MTGLRGKDWKNQWKGYRENTLFSKGSEAVQANLYPLGKPHRSSWPAIYTKMGLIKDEYYAWIASADSGRFSHIRKTRSQSGNPLTICFGTSVWSDFIECFALHESRVIDYQNVFCFYPEEMVVLTPFFWTGGKNGMTQVRVQKLIDLINKVEMNPYKESNQQASSTVPMNALHAAAEAINSPGSE